MVFSYKNFSSLGVKNDDQNYLFLLRKFDESINFSGRMDTFIR